MILETVIAALVPVGVEGLKRLIDRFSGGVRPTTVDEEIKLLDADIKRLEAIAALDNPYGSPSQWVVDLRAASRYVAAIVVILAGTCTFYVPGVSEAALTLATEAVSIVFGFLFGTRILSNLTRK